MGIGIEREERRGGRARKTRAREGDKERARGEGQGRPSARGIFRLPESLWQDIARWAEDDFRSINGQIEYILTRASKEFRK